MTTQFQKCVGREQLVSARDSSALLDRDKIMGEIAQHTTSFMSDSLILVSETHKDISCI